MERGNHEGCPFKPGGGGRYFFGGLLPLPPPDGLPVVLGALAGMPPPLPPLATMVWIIPCLLTL